MKKDELLKLGLSEELAEKVAAASAEEMKGYVPKARFDEVNEAKKKAESDVSERDKQISQLKTAAKGNEELEQKIASLQEQNKKASEKYESEIKALKVSNAVDTALTNAHAKNKTAVKALLEGLDDAEVLEDGTVKGLAEQIEKLTTGEDTAFLFESNKPPQVKGATLGDPSDPCEKTVTKEDFAKMGYKERNELFQADRELYDQLVAESE
jgi:hypothetical protein